MHRAARSGKHRPLFQEAQVEHRAAMEMEDANTPWDAREREIIMEMESYLQRRERTLVRLHELEKVWL